MSAAFVCDTWFRRYFQLGRTYKLIGDTAKSLEHYNMYLQLCKDIDDKVGEGQACSALASAHEAAGELSKAISFLEIFYELSQMTGELASQEEACTRLGKIYFQTEDYNNSVRFFEKVRRRFCNRFLDLYSLQVYCDARAGF
jgi:tetratricopeptide (TPR) repeat protein